ncbi:MAG: 4-hydroxyphenylpyruvate dioxygenase [Coleofasciculaceae cyanobacterium SM2_1_6]|nr:4-hydroxyphenylpyruvate dioxygenase [Coleofasciculaceae cyanobacterium SM2_1_6]
MYVDHVHFYVEDARKWSHWFQANLDFQSLGTEINKHTHTEILGSGMVQFRLSSSLDRHSPVANFLQTHPPGVVDIALVVDDLPGILARAAIYGGKIYQGFQKDYQNTQNIQDIQNTQEITSAKIKSWGTLSHTLLKKPSIYQYISPSSSLFSLPKSSPYIRIDHLVLNVPPGELAQAVQWYQQVFQLQPQQEFSIATPHSGLCSQVLLDPQTGFQLPINEPTSANSQIQEFLDLNHGAGIQHLALQVHTITELVTQLRGSGVEFLPISPDYYQELQARGAIALSSQELAVVKSQEILVDWEAESPESLLLQIFTQPIFSQPTFFFELIERRSHAQGFGARNFRALFTAMEQEQHQRHLRAT